MTVTDLIGNVFTYASVLAGIFIGNHVHGEKGAMIGLIIGYVGGYK
jgi:hypothetical protein